ncbi:MAG: DUF1489 domain-containing protein [Alphaproteobacteria bacterium]|nr:DUF1489 domain-containing protein [Alphaproteobacteria bacterium]
MRLHMTKVAVGCRSLDHLRTRQAARIEEGDCVCWTRFLPKRAAELVGGSLYWIVKHTLVGRQEILGFDEVETDRGTYCRIRLAPAVVPVLAQPLRAHQGWRYLEPAAAPPDLDAVGGDVGELPAPMLRELRSLYLV